MIIINEIPRVIKFIETESKILGGGEDRGLFNRYSFSFAR